MNCSALCIGLVLSNMVAFTIKAQNDDFPVLKGAYLGQKPPGNTAVLFAPDIIKFEAHDSPIFLPDNSHILIGSMDEGLKCYTYANNQWTFPGEAPFPLPERINGINVTPSGKRIYFLIWENSGDENFWFVEKRENQWSPLQTPGNEINSFKTHWQFSLSQNGNLYFQSEGKILVSKFYDGKHSKPVPLKLIDGRDLDGFSPFISPDESYIIISTGKDISSGDLVISYKRNDGKWSKPINLGADINAQNALDICPKVSPDGKALFFLSTRTGSFRIYWVSAKIIEELRPKEQ